MANSGLSPKIIFTRTLVLTFILISVQGAPADLQSEIANKNCSDSENKAEAEETEEYEVIDQRQNGTENYRINVKDVVLIWAPADALFAATALLDTQILGGDFLGSEEFSDLEKPQNQEPPQAVVEVMESEPPSQNSSAGSANETSPINPTTKPAHLSTKLRHSALIGPLLKRKQ